ncbi:MAG: PQQ-binding-like beta-propeller repeat protein [Verrucomicrobiota bacterium]|nr:PQQ-binding-like beta-propeller repeat protein [Verrucomicrobiota bacterium]
MKFLKIKALKSRPLIYLICFLVGTVQSNAEWKFFRGSPDMKGVADAKLNLPLQLQWSAKIGRSVFATPIISDDKVFVGNEEGRFVCLSLTEGNVLWEFNTDDIIEGTACVEGDSVLFGSGDGHLYSLNTSNGKLKWKYETEGEILGGVNLFKSKVDQKLYALVGSYDNYMHCVSLAKGKLKWKYETQNYVNGAPGISDGKIYFGGCDAQIYGIKTETGKVHTTMDAENYIANSIVVVDSVAYVAHHGNRVAAFDLNKKQRLWEFGERDFPFFSSPAVTKDSVYAAGKDKRLYKINRKTGEGIWEFKTGQGIESSPVVSGNSVFIGSGDGSLYAIDIQSGKQKWSYELGDNIRSSPAITRAKLVIGCDDGKIYCFSESKN